MTTHTSQKNQKNCKTTEQSVDSKRQTSATAIVGFAPTSKQLTKYRLVRSWFTVGAIKRGVAA
jgi:hypothetical protein